MDTPSIITHEDGFRVLPVIENNYFGTNTPFEEGLVLERVKDNCIMLNISLPDNDDITNLTVGKKIQVLFQLSGNTTLLPKFSVNLANVFGDAELSQDSITFDGDQALVYLTPRAKGEGSVVLGYDLKRPIKPSFDYAAYGDLKNYSIEISSKDSVEHSDDLDVTIKLLDGDSNPVTGKIALYVNGKSYGDVDVSNGVGEVTLSKLDAPSAVLSAYYNHELPDHNDADVEKTISVSKSDLDLKYNDVRITEGDVATVTVKNIPDDLTSSVVISLSNEGGQVHQSNGVASQSFSNLAAGSYKVSIFALGDKNYNMFDDFVILLLFQDLLKTGT